jgi:hypothetical protein
MGMSLTRIAEEEEEEDPLIVQAKGGFFIFFRLMNHEYADSWAG